jgi:hypothetical protein
MPTWRHPSTPVSIKSHSRCSSIAQHDNTVHPQDPKQGQSTAFKPCIYSQQCGRKKIPPHTHNITMLLKFLDHPNTGPQPHTHLLGPSPAPAGAPRVALDVLIIQTPNHPPSTYRNTDRNTPLSPTAAHLLGPSEGPAGGPQGTCQTTTEPSSFKRHLHPASPKDTTLLHNRHHPASRQTQLCFPRHPPPHPNPPKRTHL